MLTELRLLMLEDASPSEIEKRLPPDEAEALYAWHGKKSGAVKAFLSLEEYGEEEKKLLYKKAKKTQKKDKRGRFIVLEGLDGAGKTTHIELLKKKAR